jgi:antitoxin ParD1/3/4
MDFPGACFRIRSAPGFEFLWVLNFIFAACYMLDIFEGNVEMKLVTVLLPEAYLEGLDELVRANMYPSRSSAIRSSVRDLLKKELWERRGR